MPKTIFTDAHIKLVEILKDARSRSGLTQAQLGIRLGRNQRLISLIEQGQRRVDVIELIAIAGALGIDPARIVKQLAWHIKAGGR
jgi:transcriptional regulator with XRE-family HTH domain